MGSIDTPDDAEEMKFRLEAGDHRDMSAVVPAEKDRFVIDLESDSDFSVETTRTAEWDGYSDSITGPTVSGPKRVFEVTTPRSGSQWPTRRWPVGVAVSSTHRNSTR